MERLPRQQYTKEFREQAVQLALEQALTIPEAARRLAMSEKTLANWVFRARRGQLVRLGATRRPVTDLEAEVSRLKRELAEARMARDILKKAVGSSTGRCNTSPESIRRGFISQDLSGPLIQLLRNPVELGLRMCRELRALRKVLPKESVRVFVGAALPGALRITEIHPRVRR